MSAVVLMRTAQSASFLASSMSAEWPAIIRVLLRIVRFQTVVDLFFCGKLSSLTTYVVFEFDIEFDIWAKAMHCRSVQENYLIRSSRYFHPFFWSVSINLLPRFDWICVENTIKSKPSSILNRPTFLWLVITLSGWMPLVRKWTTALEKSFYIWVTKDNFKLPPTGNPAGSSDAWILWRRLRRHSLRQSCVETPLKKRRRHVTSLFSCKRFLSRCFFTLPSALERARVLFASSCVKDLMKLASCWLVYHGADCGPCRVSGT